MNAVCITRTSAYSCWLFRDFSDQYEETRLDDTPIIFGVTLFLTRFSITWSLTRMRLPRMAELTLNVAVPQDCIPNTWVSSTTDSTVVLKSSISVNSSSLSWATYLSRLNTFTAIVDLSRFNNSCLKSPASTLVDLTFQSRALRSFSLNQLRNLSL